MQCAHNSVVKFLRASKNVSFMKFLKIWMVSDKMIHKAFRTHVTPLNIKKN